MSKTKLILIYLISMVMLLTVSCQRGTQEEVQEEEKIPVYVTQVEKGNIENTVRYLGNIEAAGEVMVFSKIPNQITSIKAYVNDQVDKGDVLAVVKNTKLEQAVKQAQAGLESAQANYENVLTEWNRTKRLYEEDAISKSQYDAVQAQKKSAKSGVDQAQAALENAKEQYEDSFIKAPISGIVSDRNYDPGEQTSPQQPAYGIVNMDKVKIKLDVVEEDLAKIEKGNKVYVKVNSYPDQVFEGQVKTVYPTINPRTRTAQVEVVLDNKDGKLKSGMYATVNIVTQSSQNTVMIPSYTVVEKTTRKHMGGELTNTEIEVSRYVYVIKDSVAHRRDIKAGIINDDYTEVLAGLEPGETLVTRGQYRLTDQGQVKIVTE